ncbi:hypothetical protein NL676_035006 [Syzygium grande]|nr:hypothetical protein NL676_035006 [Syzygium grande]
MLTQVLSQVEVSKPDNTEHSSSKGVDRKNEGNEGGIDYIRCNDDELMKLNRFPDGGTAWRKIASMDDNKIKRVKSMMEGYDLWWARWLSLTLFAETNEGCDAFLKIDLPWDIMPLVVEPPDGEHLNNFFMVGAKHGQMDLFSLDPNLRPKASEVLHHPFFWNSEMRLSFLDLLKALENTAQLVFDGNWDDKIEPEVMADLRKRRKYDCSRVRDLLRAVRNKCSHYTEAPKEIKEILGSFPDGLDAYFARRFPRLLIESYRVVSRICKEEECFQKYLLFPPWPLPTEIPSSSQQGRP